MQEKITIDRLTHGDAGIGRTQDGRAIFVNQTCPGDIILVDNIIDKGNYCEGTLEEIITPSNNRVTPVCPYAGICGGCGWQHVSYQAQLEAKRNDVVSQLTRVAHIPAQEVEALVTPCVASKKEMGYRNKLEFGCTWDNKQGFTMGLHKLGSHEMVTPDTCPLAHKAIAKAPKALRGALRYLQSTTDLGIYRVGIRHSDRTHATEVALWTNPGPFPRAQVAKTLESALKTTSIVRVMTADKGKARKLKGVEQLSGKGFWEEEICGNRFKVSAPSFFQVNTHQAEKLVTIALDQLAVYGDEFAVDLFCGVGTFTLPMARITEDVVGVEAYGSSVRDLRRACEDNKLEIEVIGGDATRELPELGEIDALLVDPPRAGLSKEIISSIGKAAPSRMVYVSCNPSTLARDIARLAEVGFKPVSVTPVDMFPQTYHVETVVLLANTR